MTYSDIRLITESAYKKEIYKPAVKICAFVDGMSHHQTLFIMSASMLHMLE